MTSNDCLGFLGLGVMGLPMAQHLAQQHPLVVFNRTREKAEALAGSDIEVAQTPAEVAARCRLIFCMLANDEAVSHVMRGPAGVFQSDLRDRIIVDHSTISPRLTRTLAAEAGQRGAVWLDAPVTGGDIGAREGTLTMMVGGPREAFEVVLPYLREMGRLIVHVGPVGQGQMLKLVANLVSALNLMAASEGVRMALDLGLGLDEAALVMQNGSAQSFELTKVLDRVRRKDFTPGFSVAHRYKDLKLALDLAREARFPADLAWSAERLYREHLARGYGAQDESSYWTRWDEG
ncbi:MAG: NAD(P)-dependent oxidoreductase [Firmicutes bacterium]|nr:NAD(P)-dependent oxidoreductase [Bacillota bacterium]